MHASKEFTKANNTAGNQNTRVTTGIMTKVAVSITLKLETMLQLCRHTKLEL